MKIYYVRDVSGCRNEYKPLCLEKYVVIWYDLEADEHKMRLFTYIQAAMQFVQEKEADAPTLYECKPVGILGKGMEYPAPLSVRGVPDPDAPETVDPGQVIAFLQRERLYNAGEDVPHFRTGAGEVPAMPENHVDLPIRADYPIAPDGNAIGELYPDCPDCGGLIEWAEARYVPGTRQCTACKALYADSRYSASIDVYVTAL